MKRRRFAASCSAKAQAPPATFEYPLCQFPHPLIEVGDVSIGVWIDQHRPSPVESRSRSQIVLSRLCGQDQKAPNQVDNLKLRRDDYCDFKRRWNSKYIT